MMTRSEDKQDEVIEAFNSKSAYPCSQSCAVSKSFRLVSYRFYS